MILTLDIDISDNKALELIKYIKSLDFISIKENTPEYTLTNEQIEILENRKQSHVAEESISYSWDSIKEELKSI